MSLDRKGKKAEMSVAGSILSLLIINFNNFCIFNILSLLLLAVTVAYSYLKIHNSVEKKEVDITSTVNQMHFSEDYVFSA